MYETNDYPVRRKNTWNAKTIAAITAIVIMALLIVAGTVIMAIMSVTPAKPDSTVGTNELALLILSCPESVNSSNPAFVAEGVIVSDSGPCTLYINDEVVASTSQAGQQVKWNKSYQIANGTNMDLKFELRDSKGVKAVEERTVVCQSLQQIVKAVTKPIVPGCTLVKKKAGGLNIREYPGTRYDVVDFIQSYDYTSKMIFTGSYRVTRDGYTWYEVISPNGKHGYVRSDLVANIVYEN